MKKCKIWLTLLLAVCIISLIPVNVSAESAATYTYTPGVDGGWVRTQDAYQVTEVILQEVTLNQPQDMLVRDGILYIADTGSGMYALDLVGAWSPCKCVLQFLALGIDSVALRNQFVDSVVTSFDDFLKLALFRDVVGLRVLHLLLERCQLLVALIVHDVRIGEDDRLCNQHHNQNNNQCLHN